MHRLLPWIAFVAACGHSVSDRDIKWIADRSGGHGVDKLEVRGGELFDLELQLLRAWQRPQFDHCVFDLDACAGGPDPSQFLVDTGRERLCARAYCGNEVEDLVAVGAPVMLPRVRDRPGGLAWSVDDRDRELGLDEIVARAGESRRVIFQTSCHTDARHALQTVKRLADAGLFVLLRLDRDHGRKCPIPEGCRTCY